MLYNIISYYIILYHIILYNTTRVQLFLSSLTITFSFPNTSLFSTTFPVSSSFVFINYRCISPQKVWYEWCLTSPIVTPVQNANGLSNWVGLWNAKTMTKQNLNVKKDVMKCTRILLNCGDERVLKAKDRFINTINLIVWKSLTYFIPINISHSWILFE